MAALEWYKKKWDIKNSDLGLGWLKNPWVWVYDFKPVKTLKDRIVAMNGLEKQIQDIENKYKIKIPPTIVDILRELDTIRKDGSDIDYGGLGKVIDVFWRSTTYGEPPSILLHRISSEEGLHLNFYGNASRLAWDSKLYGTFGIDIPRNSFIYELLDWAFGDFYDKEWRRKVVWESIVSRGKN